MAYIVKDSKKDYTPAPEGLHQGVCVDVVSLGTVKRQYKDKVIEGPMVQLRWVIEGVDPKTQKQFMLTHRYTESLHKKSALRPMLEAWRGRKFTEEELKGFDLEKLIGTNCQIQVVHNIAGDGETYANIQAVVSLGKGTAKMAVPNDYVRVCDRDKQANPDAENGEIEDEDIPF